MIEDSVSLFDSNTLKKRPRAFYLASLAILFAVVCAAQYRAGGWRDYRAGDAGPMVQTEGGQWVNEDTVRTARETASHSTGTPNWTNAPGFEKDVFTFTRLILKPGVGARGWGGGRLGWVNDYPDSDLNLSFRLQQLTSFNVDPDGRVLKLIDPALFSYPLIYMVQPGRMELRDEEVPLLRKYLLNGGALLADDFWGTREWENFEAQMRRVLPERQWSELPMEHPLLHCVFDLKGPMNNLQVPTIHLWERNYDPNNPRSTSSFRRGEGSQEMHLRAWFDDQHRIMVIATHNTDNGDGWEREGENEEYFHTFSETRAYPLAINILFYLMSH